MTRDAGPPTRSVGPSRRVHCRGAVCFSPSTSWRLPPSRYTRPPACGGPRRARSCSCWAGSAFGAGAGAGCTWSVPSGTAPPSSRAGVLRSKPWPGRRPRPRSWRRRCSSSSPATAFRPRPPRPPSPRRSPRPSAIRARLPSSPLWWRWRSSAWPRTCSGVWHRPSGCGWSWCAAVPPASARHWLGRCAPSPAPRHAPTPSCWSRTATPCCHRAVSPPPCPSSGCSPHWRHSPPTRTAWWPVPAGRCGPGTGCASPSGTC